VTFSLGKIKGLVSYERACSEQETTRCRILLVSFRCSSGISIVHVGLELGVLRFMRLRGEWPVSAVLVDVANSICTYRPRLRPCAQYCEENTAGWISEATACGPPKALWAIQAKHGSVDPLLPLSSVTGLFCLKSGVWLTSSFCGTEGDVAGVMDRPMGSGGEADAEREKW